LDYTDITTLRAGSRFYLRFTGAASSTSDLGTLATDISNLWNTNLAPVICDNFALTEVDVLDITTHTGLANFWTGSHGGSMGGQEEASQVSTNVEFLIGQRYRGGKPRMFLPPPAVSARANAVSWSSTHLSNVNTAMSNFMSGIAALSIGALGTLSHIVLSYYSGFVNHTNTSGRTRSVPQYRSPNALHYPVTGYAAKAEMGSQRRRRVATTF
jgi:hypothetical protein